MTRVFRIILDWSEVWATFMPLLVILFRRKQPPYMRPLVWYFIIALCINLIGNLIADLKIYARDFMLSLPDFMFSNNPLYNIHSLIRFTCYSLFFIGLGQQRLTPVYKALPLVSLLIFILNFTLIDDFFNPAHLSGNLLAGEAYLLLVYCMLYYLYKLRDDDTTLTAEPDFWAVTGLAVYVVANFFVFLFYVPMIQFDPQMANSMWDVHNYAYITLCMLTAKAFYDATRYQYSV